MKIFFINIASCILMRLLSDSVWITLSDQNLSNVLSFS